MPETACGINRRQGGLPCLPLPWGPDADKGNDRTVGIAALARYQIDGRVRNDDPTVFAQGGNFEEFLVQAAGLHRLIETPPVQWPKSRRDHDIEASSDCIVR